VRSAVKETAAEYDNFLFNCMLIGVDIEVYNCFVSVFRGDFVCWGWVFGQLYMLMGVKTGDSGHLDRCLSF
jgi:hypothetical protein